MPKRRHEMSYVVVVKAELLTPIYIMRFRLYETERIYGTMKMPMFRALAFGLLPLAVVAGCDHPPADKFRFVSPGAPGISIVLNAEEWRLFVDGKDVTEASGLKVTSIADPLPAYRITLAAGVVPHLPTSFNIQYSNGSVCVECPEALRTWKRRSIE